MRNQLLLLLVIFTTGNSIFCQTTIVKKELPNGRFGFVNSSNGASINAQEWDDAGAFVNGFAQIALDGKWGFANLKGNPAIPVQYQSVRNFSNKLAAVKMHNQWGMINAQADVVIPIEYDILYDFNAVVTAGYKNGKWFLINSTGTIIKNLDIDLFWGFKNGVAKITKQGRSGTMNTSGTILSLDKMVANKTAAAPFQKIQSTSSAACPDNIGFEDGNFKNWTCWIGKVNAVGTTNVITVNSSAPTANRHVIIPKATPSALDPYGLFPTNPPDGSNFALKLGNDSVNSEAERVTYVINVPANAVDASITYRYAVVFQDPGHLPYEQPRFSARLLDQASNTYLPCASYEYIATSGLPGFYNSTIDPTVKCKAWSSVFINLRAYAGKTLTLEFTTADCTKGKHWGYAYVDVGDCNVTADIQYNCNPSSSNLIGPPGFQTYSWWDNSYANLLGSGDNITIAPAPVLGSTLHVVVTPFNGFGCSDTLDVKVVSLDPLADAGPDITICAGGSVTLGTNSVPGNMYNWIVGGYLNDSTLAMPVSTPAESTVYVLSVTNPLNGCTHYDTVNVTVNTNPIAAFDSIPDQCFAGNSFHFNNTSAGATLSNWSFGDNSNSQVLSPIHSYAAVGSYTINLVVADNNGCKDSVSQPVAVHPNPVVQTIADTSTCSGKGIQLQTNGAIKYVWTPSANLSCSNCANPMATPVSTSSYIVNGTNNFGCSAADTVAVRVFQPIHISVTPGNTICELQSLNLQALGAQLYTWSPALGLSSTTISNPVATPTTSTQYQVIGYDGHNCFTDTGYVNITVNPKPTLDLGPDLTLSTGTEYPMKTVFTNGPIVNWQWTPATGLSCDNCAQPVATIKNSITYHASITNSFGCTAEDSVTIKAFCLGSQVFIPNAFTPDGDGLNDILMVRAKGIQSVVSFRIYTRWGELVFEKKNFAPNVAAFGWDGKIRGVPAAPEVYVYTVEVICDNYENYMFKGNVSILK